MPSKYQAWLTSLAQFKESSAAITSTFESVEVAPGDAKFGGITIRRKLSPSATKQIVNLTKDEALFVAHQIINLYSEEASHGS